MTALQNSAKKLMALEGFLFRHAFGLAAFEQDGGQFVEIGSLRPVDDFDVVVAAEADAFGGRLEFVGRGEDFDQIPFDPLRI